MAEGQVSVDGVTRSLPSPFVVLATDNPIEYEGTYPMTSADSRVAADALTEMRADLASQGAGP